MPSHLLCPWCFAPMASSRDGRPGTRRMCAGCGNAFVDVCIDVAAATRHVTDPDGRNG
jgi:hypothetical protein